MALGFRLLALAAWLLAAVPVLAEMPGKPLSAAAIAALVTGRTIGDEAHWSYRFAGDGGLVAMDLGRSKAGHWRATGRELCLEFVDKGRPYSECYELRQAGSQILFFRDGVMIIEGRLLEP